MEQLRPPKQMDFEAKDLQMEWRQWKEEFSLNVDLSMEGKDDKTKVKMLMYLVGIQPVTIISVPKLHFLQKSSRSSKIQLTPGSKAHEALDQGSLVRSKAIKRTVPSLPNRGLAHWRNRVVSKRVSEIHNQTPALQVQDDACQTVCCIHKYFFYMFMYVVESLSLYYLGYSVIFRSSGGMTFNMPA